MVEWLNVLFLLPLAHLPLWWLLPTKRKFLHLLPGFLFLVSLIWILINPGERGDWQIPLWLGGSLGHPSSLLWVLEPHRLSMATLCCALSWLIQVYSYGYLVGQQRFALYQFLLSCFSAAMIWLFLAENLFTLLLGWEWLGLVSFLLVQFWFEKERPIQAGLRVLLINKLGDVFLLAALGMLFAFGMGHLVFADFRFPAGSEVFFQSKTGQLLGILLLLSALVKSAQFPFNIWLKEAMEGPTAVSALLHSATMVTAGVWLLLQCLPVFSPPVLISMVLVGGFTMLVAGIGAAFSGKIKETLAFSTMAQLGMLVLAIGIGKSDGVKLHLFSHAFFKSALFLMAGILMQISAAQSVEKEKQGEISLLKGYFQSKNLLKFLWIFALLALCGLPLTSGFISKDSLIPPIFNGGSDWLNILAFSFLQIGMGLTSFYSIRLMIWVAFRKSDQVPEITISRFMLIPVVILSLGCGFWLFGPNPLSSQGWLAHFWNLGGQWLFPDLVLTLLGSLAAYLSLRNNGQFLITRFPKISIAFSEMPLQYSWLKLAGKNSFRMAEGSLWLENRFLERPLIFISKVGVISGHLISFFDRKLVDGVFMGMAGTGKMLGAYFWRQATGKPQQTVFLVVFLLFLILMWMAKG